MDLETGGREKETRRQRGREKHEGQYKKKSLFTTGKSWQDEEVSDFLKENKLFCSIWAVGSDASSVSSDAAHPPVTLHNSVSKNQCARSTAPSHPHLTPALKSSVERLGCHRGQPALPHCFSSSSPIYPSSPSPSAPSLRVTTTFASKALPASNLIFQHRNSQTSKHFGEGGAKSWLPFSYVMDEHTP